ncbi:MAG: tetratricopeptide repeat protein [Pirellulaceae bacterium]
MKTNYQLKLGLVATLVGLMVMPLDVYGRGGRGGGGGGRVGGGGGRPSMGGMGGGGGRPSMGGGARPAPRPSAPRPSGGSRPSMGNATRPSMPSRPSTPSRPGGGFSPSGGGVARPAPRPGGSGIANRPSLGTPGGVGPTRPSFPSSGLGGGATRPTPGINRPATMPGSPGLGANRPGGDRPSFGGANRPSTLPAPRPGIGGGGSQRPGIGGGGIANRPGVGGGGSNRPGRPGIGGGPNRPGIGNGDINIGNGNINIGNGNIGNGNRPNWDRPNWDNPGWGWGGDGGWAGNWHDHCINGDHGWYNGCWGGGYWGSGWYAPGAWVGAAWGLSALTSGWGYGESYSNPYYTESVASEPYDYSQPVVVENYATDTAAEPAPAPEEDPAAAQAMKLFNGGLAQFKSGDYKAALASFDGALRKLPNDPVVHEVRALTLFALGDYKTAAAALNSFLSSAPGMDWTTMSGLYGNADDYSAQLRKLEEHCRANQKDSGAAFVLAYHYLVLGSKDSAISALKAVVKNQPKDFTAKRMLDALVPPEQPSPAPEKTVPSSDAPQTDLVGKWRAKSGKTTIDLAITEDSQFTWKAASSGKPAVDLQGELTSTGSAISLDTKDQGSMAGSVKSAGPDKWQFALSGAPASDSGLTFERVSK